ncbi:Dimethylaniline monooxygenase [N-oxide-forming] 3 [Cyphellophora attinorum]|uniref:Dimethylaniline monooxygenase [N-oxide-forming] 3 n=1 Tax=Cyphellophora attinorum TaxID=1664694 RepID=A0A0N0NQY8_9EURO|nr:Dimethylaniline monooxygenase [N-oxide-forming] 3 [Phialophora attinorum]KPI44468.1 Dimethylaniline monooxygenase [N-oxide-forming] 3 [Phialophora attinorum]
MGERVAVIGLGLHGVVALKNLREEGFDAVGFDKNPYIGGLWRYTTDETTLSVTQHTKTNNSQQRLAFSDFPARYTTNYPDAREIADYIDEYAKHFNLVPHCRLGLGLHRLDRSDKSEHWDLTLQGRDGSLVTEQFSRVLLTTGSQNRLVIPKFEGQEHFKGKIIHSRAFKDAKPFAGQRVLLVGLSNTAGDVAAELSEVCPEVFVSHRSGVLVVERTPEGQKPTDHLATRRVNSIILTINRNFPRVAGYIGNIGLELKMKYAMKVKPEWGLLPAHPIANAAPMMNDYFLDLSRSGRLKHSPGISSMATDGHTINFTNGTSLSNVDTIILCTGAEPDFSFLGPSANPTLHPTPEWDNHRHNFNHMPYPRLFRGVFPPSKHTESLAFIGAYRGHGISAFINADLASQAIAQVWKGNFELPPQAEREAWCDEHYKGMLRHLEAWRTVQVGQNAKEFERFLNEAAGNGINQKLGWGWEGWSFMFRNWRLYRLLMDGVDGPWILRLFDSPREERGRKKWEGAEAEVWRVNGLEPPTSKKAV